MTAGRAAIRWCAVYTRKSTDDGLEQEFNSLHAQRARKARSLELRDWQRFSLRSWRD